jgi:hypothetical protein
MNQSDDRLLEGVVGKGKVTYTIRLPLDVSARYETDAARRNVSPTHAVTDGTIRGSFTFPEAPEAEL